MHKSDVYQHFGGCAGVARALEITTASVASWGEVIPQGRAYQVEVITGGALKVDPALYQPAMPDRATA